MEILAIEVPLTEWTFTKCFKGTITMLSHLITEVGVLVLLKYFIYLFCIVFCTAFELSPNGLFSMAKKIAY